MSHEIQAIGIPTHAGRQFYFPGSIDRRRAYPVAARAPTRLDWLDCALICLFLLGLYTNYTIQISAKVPLPSMPSGVAGLLLLWRRRDLIRPAHLAGLFGVLALYLISILWATNIEYLPRRTNGLIQLTYSITIGYALFLTVTQGTRQQIGRLFLTFAVVILIGCLLEAYGGLRPVSDAVRSVLYSRGLYENDLRDVLFYNRVRPKFFASEPASVTFCYTLFTFIWMVVSPWRWKLPVYVGLIGLGLFAMPGPTLLLMLLLILPYMLFLASRRRGRLDAGRFMVVACVAVAVRRCLRRACAVAVSRAARRDHIGQRSQFLLPGARTGHGRRGHHGALPLRRRRPLGRAFHRERGHKPLCALDGLFCGLADRLAGHRAADQLFLAALDLSRNCLGPDHHCRADGLAAACWACRARRSAGWRGRSWGKPRAPMSGRPAGRCCSWPAPPPCCISAPSNPRQRTVPRPQGTA